MEISQTMAVLGRVEAGVVEALLLEFGERLVRNGGVAGGFDATEKLLLRALDPGRAESIMQEIRGPVGRTVWDKLAHVNETVLASYLKNEYPQITKCRIINISIGYRQDHGRNTAMSHANRQQARQSIFNGLQRVAASPRDMDATRGLSR